LFRIHQQNLSLVKPWAPGQKTPVIAAGVQRRAGFKTYQATSVASGAVPSGGVTLLFIQTGGVTPIHTEGAAWDGDQSTTIDPIGSATYYSTGVEWTYQDCGYGVLRITGFTDSTHATAVVVRQLPTSIVGSGNASYLWEFGAWNAIDGYPSHVVFFRQRLTYAHNQRVWMSVVGDFTNFADLDFGEVLADSAVTASVLSDQVNRVTWLSAQESLLIGTTGGEIVIGQQSISDPFGPNNLKVAPQSTFGGRAVPPIRVQTNTLFVQRNGRALREFVYSFSEDAYRSNDLTVQSEHVTIGGIIGMAWARNPYSVIWCALGNGDVAAFTYNPEQEVKAWHRHDIGPGQVVSITSVPNSTGVWDDVYLVVRRPISSNNYAYVIERIEQPFANEPGSAQQDAFYVDCGLTLRNNINATLTPGGLANEQGATASFTAGANVFAPADIGRYIHYDWETTQVGEDGLTYPLHTRGVAQITAYLSPTQVVGTVIAPWPNNSIIPANGWRLTVTVITIPGAVPWFNETISLLADGACQPDQLYLGGGTITLQYPASIVQAGIKSPSVLQTMRPEGGGRVGTIQGKLKRVVRATVRILNTLGLKLGRNRNSLVEIEMRSPAVPDDNPPPLQSGDTPRESFNGDWDRDGRVMIVQDQPLPLTVSALAISLEIQEDG
jgi:hypothetical protein